MGESGVLRAGGDDAASHHDDRSPRHREDARAQSRKSCPGWRAATSNWSCAGLSVTGWDGND